MRIYLYESFAIILTSMIIGFTIGLLVSITSGMQNTLFLEVPYTFTVFSLIQIVSHSALLRNACTIIHYYVLWILLAC